MTSCNRDLSPIVKKGKERHTELILQDGKVHRLQLNAPVICKLAYVESPNCIWFTLHNNISDELVVIKPARLEQLLPSKKDLNNNATKEDIPVARFSHQIAEIAKLVDDEEEKKKEPPIYQYQYVLAPLQENVYARGRIIFLQDFKTPKSELQFAYVHFIDRGYGNWMSTKCLAKMEPQLYLHPWQAFPVSLFRLGVDPEGQLQQWPFELTYSLIEVLTDYEYFKVVPVIDSRRNPNYYEYKRAEVYGLESLNDIVEEEGKAESIAHRLLIEFGEQMADYEEEDKENGQNKSKSGYQMKMEKMVDQMSSLMLESCFDRSLYDAKQQKLLREQEPKLTLEELGEMPKWRLKWPKHFGVGKPQTGNDNTAMMNGEINEGE